MTWQRTRGIAAEVTELAHTGSTNADLRERAASGALPHLTVLLTRDQRSGRGRLDRQWQAPAGASLAVSALVRVERIPLELRGWLPLAAGAAMARAIGAQLPGRAVGAKWPNDILVDGAKICGILAEAAPDMRSVIIGTGINTRMAEAELPVPTATSFAVLGAVCDEDDLLARYLRELDRMIAALAAGESIREQVLETLITVGQSVRVMMPSGDDLVGEATGLDADGRLQVRTASGVEAVSAGDVVHVRPL